MHTAIYIMILCVLGCILFLHFRIRELEKAIEIAEENIRSLNRELGSTRGSIRYIYDAIDKKIKDDVEEI